MTNTKLFVQRGNLTECVQWNGFNVDAVRDFIQPRVREGLPIDSLEFITTLFRHLIIVVNYSVTEASVVGKTVISRGTWLVDQGPQTEGALGVAFCEEARFHHLYTPAPPAPEPEALAE